MGNIEILLTISLLSAYFCAPFVNVKKSTGISGPSQSGYSIWHVTNAWLRLALETLTCSQTICCL